MYSKYFIAVVPPEPLLFDIYQIKKNIYINYGTKGALNSPAHITLHMPFLWLEAKESVLLNCLTQFNFNTAFTVQLQNFNCFEPRVIFIDIKQNEQLYLLQQQLVQHIKTELHLFNQSDSLRGFHPHITIAFRDLKKSVFYTIWDAYKGKVITNEFSFNSICLLKQTQQKWHIHQQFHFNSLTTKHE